MSLTAFFGKRSNAFLILFSLSLVSLIAYLDYETGLELGLYIFYFLPIVLLTWYIDFWVGASMALVCSVLWLCTDTMLGHEYSHPLIPYWNTAMRFATFSITVIFLSKLKISFEAQKTLSRTDYLTGLYNARTFTKISVKEIERARRYSRHFTVGFMDVDNFKQVNDRFGHKSGDELLKTVAQVFRDSLRKVDFAARIGGDEFIILLPETGALPAKIVFSRLMDKLRYTMEMKEWPVTFSFGVITFNTAPKSVDEMMSKADALMYEAKNNGKNAIRQEIFEVKVERERPDPIA